MTENTNHYGDYDVTEVSDYKITLKDGTILAARVWIPINLDNADLPTKFYTFKAYQTKPILNEKHKSVGSEMFPVIPEYHPFSKDLFSLLRDHRRHPWFSSHGYVCLRLETRGSGSSTEVYFGEYPPQEQRDCEEVLRYLVAQPWCNGKNGMFGKSWGGFSGHQMAYYQTEHSHEKLYHYTLQMIDLMTISIIKGVYY